MTEAETHTATRESKKEDTSGLKEEVSIHTRLDKLSAALEAMAIQVGEVADAIASLKDTKYNGAEPRDGAPREDFRQAAEALKDTAENMPIEVGRAVVTELNSAVANLTTGMEVKIQGLGDTAKSLHVSAVAIERDILEARAIHEAHLEVRERWALIVMLISLWFSVVIFLSVGYLWFRL